MKNKNAIYKMTDQQAIAILEDPEILRIQRDLRAAGAPVDAITLYALNEATKGMSPGTAVATRLVADCLLQRLKEIQQDKKPKNFLGKVWKFVLTGIWSK